MNISCRPLHYEKDAVRALDSIVLDDTPPPPIPARTYQKQDDDTLVARKVCLHTNMLSAIFLIKIIYLAYTKKNQRG